MTPRNIAANVNSGRELRLTPVPWKRRECEEGPVYLFDGQVLIESFKGLSNSDKLKGIRKKTGNN